MLQKNPSKDPFYEKVKMFTKVWFVTESFVTIGSFVIKCSSKYYLWLQFWGTKVVCFYLPRMFRKNTT